MTFFWPTIAVCHIPDSLPIICSNKVKFNQIIKKKWLALSVSTYFNELRKEFTFLLSELLSFFAYCLLSSLSKK